MGIFSRRGRGHNTTTHNNHDGVVDTNGHHDRRHNDHHHKEKRALFDMETGNFNRRPSFGQWLKMTWLDLLTMAIMGAIGLGVYEAHPAPSRSFPVTFLDGEIVYPEFAYPLRNEIVPIWEAALLGSLVPIAVILLMQIRIRSFWDVNNAIIGLLYSLIAAAVFQVFIKWLIGGLRPHFLSVCDPDPALVQAGGKGFQNIMFQRNICRGDIDQIDDSLESMPSGHSTAAWAGFLYLYYYLNAKLKVFANYHPAMWKLIAVYAPLLGAFLITGALTIDEFHNWYDCLAGAIIGSVMATSAYRMVYASVWDFRFNHIPLTRHTPFSYGAGQAGAGGFETAVFTRAGGWGYEEAFGGAPNDAAHGLRGQVMGFNTGVHDHEKGHGQGHGHGHGGILGHGRRDGDVEHNAATGHTTGHGLGHHNNNVGYNNTGIGHHNDAGYNTAGTGIGHHNDGMGHGGAMGTSQPGTMGSGDGRYHTHSRSVERKALPGHGGGITDTRPSGEYRV